MGWWAWAKCVATEAFAAARAIARAAGEPGTTAIDGVGVVLLIGSASGDSSRAAWVVAR